MGRVWFAANAPPAAKHGAICFAVAVCIYANYLQGEFVFDDHEAIENNMDVRCAGEVSTHSREIESCRVFFLAVVDGEKLSAQTINAIIDWTAKIS